MVFVVRRGYIPLVHQAHDVAVVLVELPARGKAIIAMPHSAQNLRELKFDCSSVLPHGFLLIDPVTRIDTPELSEFDGQPCVPRVLAHREECMPLLVDIAALDDQARTLATQYLLAERHVERAPVICAWLDSEASGDAIREHIANHLVGPGAEGADVFWRFYDPRVMSLALAVLDPSQRQALLGPVTSWTFPWAGHYWCVETSGNGLAAVDASSGWPRPDQWPRIDRSDLADRIVRRRLAFSVDHLAHLPSTLDRMFCEAVCQGITSPDALVDYALHRLRQAFLVP